MADYNEIGVFQGRTLLQTSGKIGGARNVFVKLQGIKNELVFPTFGGTIVNPFKGPAKFFAGDLFEFRTNDKGVRPDVYLLKTYEVVSNSTTTVNIIKDDGFRHKPFVGDIIMVAPDTIGGEGTGVSVTAVTETTVTVSEVTYDVWQITTSSSLGSLAKGTILVEAEATGSTKMLVKNINSVAPSDGDFFGTPLIASGSNLIQRTGADAEFEAAKYLYAPALGGLMYIHKMSPMPKCVLDLNRSNVNGWFKVNYYDMNPNTNAETFNASVVAAAPISKAGDPTTSTVGVLGQMYINTTDHGVFILTNISGTTSKTYTWKEITFVS